MDGEGYIPSSALELPPPAAATVADAAAVLAAAPARLTRAAAGRNHDNISRRTAVAQAAAVAAASDVGRPGAVDGEGYIPSSALELPPPAAAIVADAAAVLATAPARLTRAAAGRNHDNISRRTAVAQAAAVAAASDVGRPGAVDGEGYIPSSALELPPPAAATVADAAAVLATAPARSTRAAASREQTWDGCAPAPRQSAGSGALLAWCGMRAQQPRSRGSSHSRASEARWWNSPLGFPATRACHASQSALEPCCRGGSDVVGVCACAASISRLWSPVGVVT